MGGLYHQPAATVHGEGEVVGREGMQLRLVEQAVTDPPTLSYPNGSRRFFANLSPSKSSVHETSSERFYNNIARI